MTWIQVPVAPDVTPVTASPSAIVGVDAADILNTPISGRVKFSAVMIAHTAFSDTPSPPDAFTVITNSSTVGKAEGVGDTDGLTLGLIDGLTLGLSDGDADGDNEALGLTDGLTLGDIEAEGDTLGDIEGLIDAEGLTDGEIEGEIEELALTPAAPTYSYAP